MADFKQAIEWMKEGKKVKRDKNDIVYCKREDDEFIENQNYRLVTFNIVDFEATDWEIYDKKDDWNLYSSCLNDVDDSSNHFWQINHDDVVILKEKILGDLENNVSVNALERNNKLITLGNISEILDKRFGF